MKNSLLFLTVIFSLPVLACSFFQSADPEATATAIAAEVFSNLTAQAPTAD